MSEDEVPQEEPTIPFFPDHFLTEAKVAIVFIILAFVVGIIALSHPVGIGDPADPMRTPANAKPEWYFLFLYEMLKYLPKTLGVVLPILGILVLVLWPFLDRREDTKRARRFRMIAAAVIMTAIILLTLLGEFS